MFHSTTVCFQSLRRRSASEASVITSLRRARGSEKEEGKKWNASVWTNQRAREAVVGGTLRSHVSGACSTSVMWPPRGVLNTVNGGGDRRKEFNCCFWPIFSVVIVISHEFSTSYFEINALKGRFQSFVSEYWSSSSVENEPHNERIFTFFICELDFVCDCVSGFCTIA